MLVPPRTSTGSCAEAAAGELPIEESMAFDVSLNLRTAQALGISFPMEVLAQANLIVR
jgi:hypothetical protein